MTWLTLLESALSVLAALLSWLQRRGALTDAEAAIAARNLRSAIDEIAKANAARARARDDSVRHPDRLRDDDGFRRD